MPEQVLVFPAELLPPLPPQALFQDDALLACLLAASFFMDRDQAEPDPTYKQIIPYSILRHADRVFSYQRTRRGGEGRLFDLYSLGVGGHINPPDGGAQIVDMAVIEAGRDREAFEEFDFRPAGGPRLVGLLNDTSGAVSDVHFGVVYEYTLADTQVIPREAHKHTNYQFLSPTELQGDRARYEGWSQIVIDQYLTAR